MARIKRATRQQRQLRARQGSHRTRSIIADTATLHVAASTVVFTMVMLAIPTLMALTKQFGWW